METTYVEYVFFSFTRATWCKCSPNWSSHWPLKTRSTFSPGLCFVPEQVFLKWWIQKSQLPHTGAHRERRFWTCQVPESAFISPGPAIKSHCKHISMANVNEVLSTNSLKYQSSPSGHLFKLTLIMCLVCWTFPCVWGCGCMHAIFYFSKNSIFCSFNIYLQLREFRITQKKIKMSYSPTA